MGRAIGGGAAPGVAFHGVVVCNQGGDAAVGDPLQQLWVAAVQGGATVVQAMFVGLALHGQHQFGEAGAQQQHVARLHGGTAVLHGTHQIVVADVAHLHAVHALQVHQHAAPLHAFDGQVVHPQGTGHALVGCAACAAHGLVARWCALLIHAGYAVVLRAQHMLVAPVAVVVHGA